MRLSVFGDRVTSAARLGSHPLDLVLPSVVQRLSAGRSNGPEEFTGRLLSVRVLWNDAATRD